MKDKITGRLIVAAGVVGVLLMLSGVSMMEQVHTDAALYRYTLRAFAGLAVMLAAVAAQAVREHKEEKEE